DAKDFTFRDRKAFLMGLKLARPGLAGVKAALARGDVDAAGKKYIAYFRSKKIAISLPGSMSGKRNARYNTSKADSYLAGHLDDGYNSYEVPKTGIDWHNGPLSCLTRFPIFHALLPAFHHTRKPRYLRYAVDHILEYMKAYPIETFAGTNVNAGWQGGQAVAKPWYWAMICHRPHRLCEAVLLARQFPEVKDEELLQILQRMHEETAYLRLEMWRWVDRRHNAGPPMISGLAMSAKVLEDFKAADEWLEHAAKSFSKFIGPSFYPDGVPLELPTSYSMSMVNQFQQIAGLLRGTEGVKAVKDKLAAMNTWVVGMVRPTGTLPAYGDGGVPRLSPQSFATPVVDWLSQPWVKTMVEETKGPLPPFLNWPLKGQEQWSGYYAMRSDWTREARYLCIDGGPWGTNHQHGDKLSFVLTAFGADFIIDPTPSRYHSNEPDAFLSRQQHGFLHNTITVDGVDEFMRGNEAMVKAPLKNTWEQGKGHVLFAASYSFAPVKAVKWERRVLFAGRAYWLMQDVLTGKANEVRVEQNFQFDKDIKITFKGTMTIATAPNGARLVLQPIGGSLKPTLTIGDKKPHTTYWPNGKPHQTRYTDAGTKPSHGRGWTGRWHHKLMPAPAVTYVGKVTLPAQITVALIPFPKGKALRLPKITSKSQGAETVFTLPVKGERIRFATSVKECKVLEKER
ncbi:MAG: alginate lyase family protein, partial [Planctomycetia bacterium]|nr:alginate lyase family protein [Planctomycetia bacterium]